MSDLDALLAEVDAGAAPAAAAGGKKKRRNKKKGGGKADADDADAALKAAEEAAAAEAAAALAEMGLDDGGDGGGGGKKKRRNKKKKGGKGDDADADATPAAEAAAEPEAPKGKKGKGKGKVSAAKAAMMRKREEAERRRREEEEARKAEEEERAREEAAAKAEEEEKARRKAEKEARIEELKRQGKYKSKKQLQRERQARARVEAMMASGVRIAGLEKADESDGAAAGGAADEAAPAPAVAPVPEPEPEPEPAAESPKKREAPKADAWMDLLEDDGAAAGAEEEALWGEDGDAAGPEEGEGGDEDEEEDWMAEAEAAEEEAAADAEAIAAAEAAAAAAAAASASAAAKRRGAAAIDAANGLSLEERIEASRARRKARREEAKATRTADRLRSPICCVLGHVDTGKTSLLDRIRRTNVQGGEAGGITQQIGATYFPMDRLRKQTDKVNKDLALEYRIPGLLVVDTPGHESFTNLRARGSNLCDIAVLVVDIMHGLEPQTLESLELLRRSRTPFVVALNKVDRIYGWEAHADAPLRETLAAQKSYSVNEFETRTRDTIAAFQSQGLNAALYYENDDFRSTVSLVPTSAVTGEGIPDLLMLITQLTQSVMSHRIMFTPSVQCSVLEVKTIDGLGTTIDVCLTNGEIHEGDDIVVCGMNGAIVTTVRALLTPPPGREIRVKSDYVRNETITAAMGIKIAANSLEKAVAGTQLMVVHPDDEIEDLKLEVQKDLEDIMKGFATDSLGVHVQASTLGSLEALLEYLRSISPPVPVASVAIGTVHRRDVMQCAAMLERAPEYAIMLCFDVKVSPEAAAEAEAAEIRVFTADIIYHLTDAFEKHLEEAKARKRAEAAEEVAFPCALKILDAFNAKNPLVLGVEVTQGLLRKGTPLCCVVGLQADGTTPLILELGRVTSIQRNHIDVDRIAPGDAAVAIKIEGTPEQSHVTFGRHFDKKNAVYSRLNRRRIDILKAEFRDDLETSEWLCVKRLKPILGIL